ncbi:MAG: HTH-type transcriptional repressor CytR [Candidatus Erwinia impunctatus]|nr:HTH-type transcriptional repressor CytR [Culicoides impunctatus]
MNHCPFSTLLSNISDNVYHHQHHIKIIRRLTLAYHSIPYGATMKDVAERAGVSTATVSRALMNPEKVASRTRHKVQLAATQVGYISPIALREHKRTATHTLLVIVADNSDPACAMIIKGIETAALAVHYQTLIINHTHQAHVQHPPCFTHPILHQVDGVICLGSELPAEKVITLTDLNIPVVMANASAPCSGVPAVQIDHLSAAFDAVNHLLALGHRRVACLAGPQQQPHYRYRLQGYIQALQRYGIEINPRYIARCDFSFRSGQEALRSLIALPNAPEALFCHSDNMALGAIYEAKRIGLQIPEQLSLISFDNSELGQYSDPPLTTMASPLFEIGHCAMQLLYEQITAKVQVPVSRLMGVDIFIRGSTNTPYRS